LDALAGMKQALDYMEAGMEGRLDMESIARAGYMSPFHFQRMFHIVTGVTVAEYVRRRKLTLAAQELASSSVKVIDVAYKYGYDSPESFSKAFRRLHGISPSEARGAKVKLKAYPRLTFQLTLKGDQEMDYRIEEKEAFDVFGVSLNVTAQESEQSRKIPQFWEECHRNGTVAKLESIMQGDSMLGVCLNMQPDTGDFTYMIAGRGDRNAAAAEGYEICSIPAATWAVFTSTGPLPGAIQHTFERIFSEWFPATGYQHAGAPELEVYLPGDTCAEDYRCEIWISIVKK
jgi:Uncharacterized protein conserved in bacteria